MPVTFENRNVEGHTFQVVIYTGSVFRVDTEEGRTGYIVPGPNPSPAPYKYFTETYMEAEEGYSKMGQWLVEYTTLRPLVLINMYDLNTRNALREMMTDAEKKHINFSFPLNGNRVTRRSEANKTHHNYGVSDVICSLAAFGIDGYYIPRADFHSEIMICSTSLLTSVLRYVRQTPLSTGVRRRTQAIAYTPPRRLAFNAPFRGFSENGFRTPPRFTRKGRTSKRKSRRA